MNVAVDAYVDLRVRGRRLVLGISQTGLPMRLESPSSRVNRISPAYLAAIASLLRVPIPFFEDGPYDRVQAAAPDLGTQLSSSRTGVRLVRAFNAITDRGKRAAIVALVQELADRKA